MSFHRARVDTIRAIVAGSPAISGHHSFAAISDELEEVKTLMHVTKIKRRHLLAVLHATRALDVALKTFVSELGLHNQPSTGMGNSLTLIRDGAPSVLGAPFTMREYFQINIVKSRNRYMHEAGAYPASDQEIRTLLAEIEHCLSVVLALE